MKKIKTFADACKALKIKTTLPDVSMIQKGDQEAILAHYKLVIIARALNAGWTPNWDDSNEYKYYPYFDMRKGFGFSYSDFVTWYAFTICGSRLCFKTKELAEYAGRTFVKLYKSSITIK